MLWLEVFNKLLQVDFVLHKSNTRARVTQMGICHRFFLLEWLVEPCANH
jgi:hypothetical protein